MKNVQAFEEHSDEMETKYAVSWREFKKGNLLKNGIAQNGEGWRPIPQFQN